MIRNAITLNVSLNHAYFIMREPIFLEKRANISLSSLYAGVINFIFFNLSAVSIWGFFSFVVVVVLFSLTLQNWCRIFLLHSSSDKDVRLRCMYIFVFDEELHVSKIICVQHVAQSGRICYKMSETSHMCFQFSHIFTEIDIDNFLSAYNFTVRFDRLHYDGCHSLYVCLAHPLGILVGLPTYSLTIPTLTVACDENQNDSECMCVTYVCVYVHCIRL